MVGRTQPSIPIEKDYDTPKLILTFAAGLNDNQSPDINEAGAGYNFELGARQSKLLPRAPFDLIGTATNGSPITGIMQLKTRANVKTQLVVAGTAVYNWGGGNSFSSVGTVTAPALLRSSYWSLLDQLVITDVALNNIVQYWDGTNFNPLPTGATLTGTLISGAKTVTGLSSTAMLQVGQYVTGTGIGAAPNTIVSIDSSSQVTLSVNSTASSSESITFGVGTSFYAKYSVVFLNRVWYFNVTCGTATPHMIVASYFEKPAVVDLTNRGGATSVGGGTFTTGLEAFYLLTPDLKPINGVAVFQNILIISTTDGQLFQLTGTDASSFQFTPFFVGSAAIDNESIANIGNDVIYMRKGGNINLLSSTQYFGDVRSNDISRWIPNTVTGLSSTLICYDQTNQKVYFFVGGKVLVLFKDILFSVSTGGEAVNTGLSPWSIYTTLHPNQYNTSAVTYIQDPLDTTYNVYWGDTSGNVFMMTGTGNGDGGSYNIDTMRASRLIDVTVLKPFPWEEETLLGKLQYRRNASLESVMSISFQWTDEYTTSLAQVNLKTPPGYAPNQLWGGGSQWGGGQNWTSSGTKESVISHQDFSVAGKGSGFYIVMEAVTTASFQVDHLELY